MFGWIDISAYCPQWICIITSLLNLPSTVLHTPVSVNCSGSNDNSKANLQKLISRMHKILKIYIHVVVNVPDVFVYSLKDTIILLQKYSFHLSLCAKTWKLFTQNYEKNIFFISFHRLAVAPISDIWQQICTCRYFRYLYEIMLDK